MSCYQKKTFYGILHNLLRFFRINRDFRYPWKVKFTNSWTASSDIYLTVLLIQRTPRWTPLTPSNFYLIFLKVLFHVNGSEEVFLNYLRFFEIFSRLIPDLLFFFRLFFLASFKDS